jgi:hypothetical protein
LSNLGRALKARSEKIDSANDLDEAVDAGREAASGTSGQDDNPDHDEVVALSEALAVRD